MDESWKTVYGSYSPRVNLHGIIYHMFAQFALLSLGASRLHVASELSNARRDTSISFINN